MVRRRTCNGEFAGTSPGRSASRATLGKLFTHLCLCSPSSINWYRRQLGAKQALHTSDATQVTQHTLVRGHAASAGGLLKRRSAPPYSHCGSGRTLAFSIITNNFDYFIIDLIVCPNNSIQIH